MNKLQQYMGCRHCKHYQLDGSCPAFSPEPIPISIASGQLQHTEPVYGQKNSIVYEKSEKSILERYQQTFRNKSTVSISDRIEITHGDITQLSVDAIVNAANQSLMAGGGVCGAIHRAAGPALEKACLSLGWCEEGEAKITPAFQLEAKWVIHTVGPVWEGGNYGEEKTLASCYRNCLQLAVENTIRTIAFPAISTGTYEFPLEIASRIAMSEVAEFLRNDTSIERVIFVCFDDKNFHAYTRAAELEKIQISNA